MFTREKFTCYREVKPTFSDYDYQGNLRLSSILRYASDLAGEDFADRGLSWEQLQRQSLVFLVSRMAVRVHRPIRDNETVTFATYQRGTDGPYCNRNYYVLDENGDIAISAKSGWIVCEPQSRRILKPSLLPVPIESHPDMDVDCPEPRRLRIPEGLLYVGDRPVVYSDIDSNGHVNNSVYADIACDFLPPEYLERPVRDFSITFRQEAKPGSTLSVSRYLGKGYAVVVGAAEGSTCFEARLDWDICDSITITPER